MGLITTNFHALDGTFHKSINNKDVLRELRKRLPQPIPVEIEAQLKNVDLTQLERDRWQIFTLPLIGRTVKQQQFWEREIPLTGTNKMHVFDKVVLVSPSDRRMLVSILTIGASDHREAFGKVLPSANYRCEYHAAYRRYRDLDASAL